MTQRDTLVGLQRAGFARASVLDKRFFGLQVLASAFVVASLLLPEGPVVRILGPMTLLVVACALVVNVRSKAQRLFAERVRRATLLVDGLGGKLSLLEMRRLGALAGMSEAEIAIWNDPSYFVATAPPGVERATEMLEESALWSTTLFRRSADRTLFWMLGLLGVAVASLLIGLELFPAESSSVQAKIFSGVATAIFSVELLTRWWAYRIAARDVDDVLTRLEQLRRLGFHQDDFLLALGDYNSAVEGAPLMAPGVYAENREKLDELHGH